MNQRELKELLEKVKEEKVSTEDALLQIRKAPYEDIGFAKIDTHRALRQGMAEVIYGAGKTKEQISSIVDVMQQQGQETILITRLGQEAANYLRADRDLIYNEAARIGFIGRFPDKDGLGTVVVASGGTSDYPVSEEAALTAEAFGNEVIRLYDVGVAGLHRLLDHTEEIMRANVIIAVAGMEGALASVIGGMADCPVIAVPTSVGYGANFGGLSALLSMLNSCASGVSVVNIDNGFGAGYQASLINHPKLQGESKISDLPRDLQDGVSPE